MFQQNTNGTILILAAAGISAAYMLSAFFMDMSRGNMTKEAVYQAGYFATKAGAVAWIDTGGNEYITLVATEKYFNANISKTIVQITRSDITIDSLSRKIRVHVQKDVPSMFGFFPAQKVDVTNEANF